MKNLSFLTRRPAVRWRSFLFLLLFALWTGSCRDDADEELPDLPTPDLSARIELVEQMSDSEGSTLRTETYEYGTDGQLASCTVSQVLSWRGEAIDTLSSRTTVTRSDGQIVLTDDWGNESLYLLDAGGYATSCRIREAAGGVRDFRFAYSEASDDGRHYLQEVTERVGEEPASSSRISIGRAVGQPLHVTQEVGSSVCGFHLTIPVAGGTPNADRLPLLFLTELYPLSLHVVALYGGWLGDADAMLPTTVQPEGADERQAVSYRYTTDEQGMLTACEVLTTDGSASYRRTLHYRIERSPLSAASSIP